MLKAAGIQSDTTVRRSAVEQENLEQYLKSEKIGFLEVINKPCIYTFFKDYTSRNRTLPFILKYRNQIHKSSSWHILDKVLDETFQQFGKQNSLKHLLKSSANKYESQVFSSSQPLEYNQDPTAFWQSYYYLFNQLVSYRNIMHFWNSSKKSR